MVFKSFIRIDLQKMIFLLYFLILSMSNQHIKILSGNSK